LRFQELNNWRLAGGGAGEIATGAGAPVANATLAPVEKES